MDGVDAALVRLGERPELLRALCLPYPDDLRQQIEAAADPDARLSLSALAKLDVQVGLHFADAAQAVLREAGVPAGEVRAIGSHGQTVAHYPEPPHPSSLQIGDANIIAERTGITTVADFRRRDLAVGGQGAPLVPAFHHAVLQSAGETRAVVNIGGMANVTVLAAEGTAASGFDTGPGNALLDAWSARHLRQAVDEGGRWGAGGQVLQPLLQGMRSDPYFQRRPPKSTGREYFNIRWLEARLTEAGQTGAAPQDVQATLAQLTADTIAEAVRGQAEGAVRVIVCGGGVHNRDLMARLAAAVPCPVESSAAYGVDPDWMEAMAFAWLAARRLAGETGNLPTVTGAKGAAVLGAVYPGRDFSG